MGAGGAPHRALGQIRERWPLSIHGVGLSIGAAARPDRDHIARLKLLCDRYEPHAFSEHLAWSTHGGVFFNDLLPLPYLPEALGLVCDHIDEIQTRLCRRMLLENPATYLDFDGATMGEIAFLGEVVRRTGCGLLLDVNNVHVSATNHGYSAEAYLDDFPIEHVEEIHLAGFAVDADDQGRILLIDAHGAAVDDAVWTLYERAIRRAGARPTLIEWDNNVPAWPVLRAEATKATRVLSAAPVRGTSGRAA
jgi:uncharacterized protein (UPF0276 family)